jgi:transposase
MGKILTTNMRRKMEKEARRREAVRLYFDENKNQKEIALELGISVPTVSVYLKQTREAWAERANVTINDHVNRELANIEKQEANIYQWLDFFKLDPDDPQQTSRNSPEARKWLELWIKLAARKAALLGLDKAKKFEVESGQPVIINLLPVDGSQDDRPEIIEGKFTEVDEETEGDEEDY